MFIVSLFRVRANAPKNFVRLDNLNFAAELEKSGFSNPTTPKRKADDVQNDDIAPNYYALPPLKRNGEIPSAMVPSESNLPPPYLSHSSSPPFSEPDDPRMPTNSTKPLKSYDEAIPISLKAPPSTIDPTILHHQAGEQQPAWQEMEDRGGMMSIMQPRNDGRSPGGYTLGSYVPEISMDDTDIDSEDVPQSKDIEFVPDHEARR